MDDAIQTTAEMHEAERLPRIYARHTDPEQEVCADCDVPDAVKQQPVAQKSPAQWAYERTVIYLKKFEEGLDNEHEVAMGFVGGNAGVLRIEGMGYFDPDIVTFYGTDPAGNRTQLVQHVSQLNVMFRSLPKAVQGKEPKRIGFRLFEDIEKGAEDTA